MDQEIHIPTSVVVGSIFTVATGLFAWIIRVAAKQTLDSFKESIKEHTLALRELSGTVENHRREMADLRVVQADFNARLRALERIAAPALSSDE